MDTNTNHSPSSEIAVYALKAKKYTLLVLGISWAFGFIATALLDFKNPLEQGIIMLVFSFIPATIAVIINKREGGGWKGLRFTKPSLKSSIYAFLVPPLFFILVISTQVLVGTKAFPDWSKLGMGTDMSFIILFAIIGYPITSLLIMGEEVGWRGYLQEKLMKGFGDFKGIVLLGLIWGIWHMPVALQGYNFPDHPLIEAFLTYPLVGVALSLIIAYYGFSKYSLFFGVIVHGSNNHFGGILLTTTETHDEFAHAMIFNGFYVVVILIYGYLLRKKFARCVPEA